MATNARAIRFLLLILMLTGAVNLGGAPSDERDAVRKTLDRYVRAWLDGDEAGVLRLLAPDSVLIPGEKTPFVGRDAIRSYWFPPGAPPTVLTRFATAVDDVRVSGDLAVARGSQVIEWTTAGQRWRTAGNYMTVLRRSREGWLIVAQMAGNGANDRVPERR